MKSDNLHNTEMTQTMKVHAIIIRIIWVDLFRRNLAVTRVTWQRDGAESNMALLQQCSNAQGSTDGKEPENNWYASVL